MIRSSQTIRFQVKIPENNSRPISGTIKGAGRLEKVNEPIHSLIGKICTQYKAQSSDTTLKDRCQFTVTKVSSEEISVRVVNGSPKDKGITVSIKRITGNPDNKNNANPQVRLLGLEAKQGLFHSASYEPMLDRKSSKELMKAQGAAIAKKGFLGGVWQLIVTPALLLHNLFSRPSKAQAAVEQTQKGWKARQCSSSRDLTENSQAQLKVLERMGLGKHDSVQPLRSMVENGERLVEAKRKGPVVFASEVEKMASELSEQVKDSKPCAFPFEYRDASNQHQVAMCQVEKDSKNIIKFHIWTLAEGESGLTMRTQTFNLSTDKQAELEPILKGLLQLQGGQIQRKLSKDERKLLKTLGKTLGTVVSTKSNTSPPDEEKKAPAKKVNLAETQQDSLLAALKDCTSESPVNIPAATEYSLCSKLLKEDAQHLGFQLDYALQQAGLFLASSQKKNLAKGAAMLADHKNRLTWLQDKINKDENLSPVAKDALSKKLKTYLAALEKSAHNQTALTRTQPKKKLKRVATSRVEASRPGAIRIDTKDFDTSEKAWKKVSEYTLQVNRLIEKGSYAQAKILAENVLLALPVPSTGDSGFWREALEIKELDQWTRALDKLATYQWEAALRLDQPHMDARQLQALVQTRVMMFKIVQLKIQKTANDHPRNPVQELKGYTIDYKQLLDLLDRHPSIKQGFTKANIDRVEKLRTYLESNEIQGSAATLVNKVIRLDTEVSMQEMDTLLGQNIDPSPLTATRSTEEQLLHRLAPPNGQQKPETLFKEVQISKAKFLPKELIAWRRHTAQTQMQVRPERSRALSFGSSPMAPVKALKWLSSIDEQASKMSGGDPARHRARVYDLAQDSLHQHLQERMQGRLELGVSQHFTDELTLSVTASKGGSQTYLPWGLGLDESIESRLPMSPRMDLSHEQLGAAKSEWFHPVSAKDGERVSNGQGTMPQLNEESVTACHHTLPDSPSHTMPVHLQRSSAQEELPSAEDYAMRTLYQDTRADPKAKAYSEYAATAPLNALNYLAQNPEALGYESVRHMLELVFADTGSMNALKKGDHGDLLKQIAAALKTTLEGWMQNENYPACMRLIHLCELLNAYDLLDDPNIFPSYTTPFNLGGQDDKVQSLAEVIQAKKDKPETEFNFARIDSLMRNDNLGNTLSKIEPTELNKILKASLTVRRSIVPVYTPGMRDAMVQWIDGELLPAIEELKPETRAAAAKELIDAGFQLVATDPKKPLKFSGGDYVVDLETQSVHLNGKMTKEFGFLKEVPREAFDQLPILSELLKRDEKVDCAQDSSGSGKWKYTFKKDGDTYTLSFDEGNKGVKLRKSSPTRDGDKLYDYFWPRAATTPSQTLLKQRGTWLARTKGKGKSYGQVPLPAGISKDIRIFTQIKGDKAGPLMYSVGSKMQSTSKQAKDVKLAISPKSFDPKMLFPSARSPGAFLYAKSSAGIRTALLLDKNLEFTLDKRKKSWKVSHGEPAGAELVLPNAIKGLDTRIQNLVKGMPRGSYMLLKLADGAGYKILLWPQKISRGKGLSTESLAEDSLVEAANSPSAELTFSSDGDLAASMGSLLYAAYAAMMEKDFNLASEILTKRVGASASPSDKDKELLSAVDDFLHAQQPRGKRSLAMHLRMRMQLRKIQELHLNKPAFDVDMPEHFQTEVHDLAAKFRDLKTLARDGLGDLLTADVIDELKKIQRLSLGSLLTQAAGGTGAEMTNLKPVTSHDLSDRILSTIATFTNLAEMGSQDNRKDHVTRDIQDPKFATDPLYLLENWAMIELLVKDGELTSEDLRGLFLPLQPLSLSGVDAASAEGLSEAANFLRRYLLGVAVRGIYGTTGKQQLKSLNPTVDSMKTALTRSKFQAVKAALKNREEDYGRLDAILNAFTNDIGIPTTILDSFRAVLEVEIGLQHVPIPVSVPGGKKTGESLNGKRLTPDGIAEPKAIRLKKQAGPGEIDARILLEKKGADYEFQPGIKKILEDQGIVALQLDALKEVLEELLNQNKPVLPLRAFLSILDQESGISLTGKRVITELRTKRLATVTKLKEGPQDPTWEADPLDLTQDSFIDAEKIKSDLFGEDPGATVAIAALSVAELPDVHGFNLEKQALEAAEPAVDKRLQEERGLKKTSLEKEALKTALEDIKTKKEALKTTAENLKKDILSSKEAVISLLSSDEDQLLALLDEYQTGRIEAEDTASKITKFLIISTQIQQMEEFQKTAGGWLSKTSPSPSDTELCATKLCTILAKQMNWKRYLSESETALAKPSFDRKILCLEYRQKIILRQSQINVLKKIQTDPSQWLSLRMGEGKTFLIMPTVAALLMDKGTLPVMCVPPQLQALNQADFDSMTQKNFGKRGIPFSVELNKTQSTAYLAQLYGRLLEGVKNGQYPVTTVPALASLRSLPVQLRDERGLILEQLMELHESEEDPELLEQLALRLQEIEERLLWAGQLECLFDGSIHYLDSDGTAKVQELDVQFYFDEADSLLHISKEINRANKDAEPVEEEIRSTVFKVAQHLLESTTKGTQNLRDALTSGIQTSLKGELPKLLEALLEDYLRANKKELPEGIYEGDQPRKDVINFLMGTTETCPEGAKWPAKGGEQAKDLACLKHLFSTTFPNLLNTEPKQSYRLDKATGLLAVPAELTEETVGDRYSDPYEIVAFEFFAHIQAPFTKQDTKDGVQPVQDCYTQQLSYLQGNNAEEYQRLTAAMGDGWGSASIEAIATELADKPKHMKARLLLAQHAIFAQQLIKRNKEQIKVSAQAIVSGVRKAGGVTGTLNAVSLPGYSVAQNADKNARAVEVEVYKLCAQSHETRMEASFPSFNDSDKDAAIKAQLNLLKDPETSAIINEGAYGVSASVTEWVTTLRKQSKGKRTLVWLARDPSSNETKKYMWKAGEPTYSTVTDTKLKEHVDAGGKFVGLYGPQFTRGADLPLCEGKTHVLLSRTSNPATAAQSIFRAREAGGKHIPCFLIPQSLDTTKAEWKLSEIIDFLSKQGVNEQLALNLSALQLSLSEVSADAVRRCLNTPSKWHLESHRAGSTEEELKKYVMLSGMDAALHSHLRDYLVESREVDFEHELGDQSKISPLQALKNQGQKELSRLQEKIQALPILAIKLIGISGVSVEVPLSEEDIQELLENDSWDAELLENISQDAVPALKRLWDVSRALEKAKDELTTKIETFDLPEESNLHKQVPKDTIEGAGKAGGHEQVLQQQQQQVTMTKKTSESDGEVSGPVGDKFEMCTAAGLKSPSVGEDPLVLAVGEAWSLAAPLYMTVNAEKILKQPIEVGKSFMLAISADNSKVTIMTSQDYHTLGAAKAEELPTIVTPLSSTPGTYLKWSGTAVNPEATKALALAKVRLGIISFSPDEKVALRAWKDQLSPEIKKSIENWLKGKGKPSLSEICRKDIKTA